VGSDNLTVKTWYDAVGTVFSKSYSLVQDDDEGWTTCDQVWMILDIPAPSNNPSAPLKLEFTLTTQNDGVFSMTETLTNIPNDDMSNINRTLAVYEIITSGIINGTVAPSPVYAKQSENVTLTVTPASGGYAYTSGSLNVNSGTVTLTDGDDDTWTFTMPASNVLVTAEFHKKNVPLSGTLTINIPLSLEGTAVKVEVYTEDPSTPNVSPVAHYDSTIDFNVSNNWNWSVEIDRDDANPFDAYIVFLFDPSGDTFDDDTFKLDKHLTNIPNGGMIINQSLNIYKVIVSNSISGVTKGGTISSSKEYEQPGTEVTLTAIPEDGYEHVPGKLMVNGELIPLSSYNGIDDTFNWEYEFTMPGANASIFAEESPFKVSTSANLSSLSITAGGASLGPDPFNPNMVYYTFGPYDDSENVTIIANALVGTDAEISLYLNDDMVAPLYSSTGTLSETIDAEDMDTITSISIKVEVPNIAEKWYIIEINRDGDQ
jgi:hypothetical protein